MGFYSGGFVFWRAESPLIKFVPIRKVITVVFIGIIQVE